MNEHTENLAPQTSKDDQGDTNETRLTKQMAGTVKANAESKQAKRQRMQKLIDAVVLEFKQGHIEKGLWKLAEEHGISLGTLNTWRNDPDWTELGSMLKLARLLTVENHVDRAIINGERVQLISNLLGIWNRLDPQSQQVSGTLTHISIVSAVRASIPDEDRQRILASDS